VSASASGLGEEIEGREERKRKKERGRTVSLPKHIDEGSAGDVNGAYTHSLEVVEMSLEAADVAAKTEVDLVCVVFEDGAEKVVVSWVTICELVEKEGVDRELTPVLRGRGVGLIWSRRPVIEDGGIWVWVDVDIPVDEVGLEFVSIDGEEEEGKGGKDEGRKRWGHWWWWWW